MNTCDRLKNIIHAYASGHTPDKSDGEWCRRYIVSHRTELYGKAMESRELLSYMTENELIPKWDTDDLVSRAERHGGEIRAMLLRYQHDIISEDDRERMDRAEEEALSRGVMSEELAESRWRYSKMESGHIKLTEYKGMERTVAVPSAIGTSPVEEIGRGALSAELSEDDWEKEKRNDISEIVLPEGIVRIGNGAFQGCKGLKNINIPESVELIGESAFGKCRSLESIRLPGNVERIGRLCFVMCSQMKEAVLCEGVRNLESFAFAGCVNLKRLKLPQSLEAIGEYAFMDCKGLDDVTVPRGTREIKSHAFMGCGRLREVNIPDTVTAIGDCAFSLCSSLKSIYIPETVTYMGRGVFEDCLGTVIKGAKGSEAERYALSENMRFEECGR